MELQQQIIFHNKNYFILSAEQEFIVHPMMFGLSTVSAEQLDCHYSCHYSIRNYQLYLDRLSLNTPLSGKSTMDLDPPFPETSESIPLYYNGAILIGYEPLREYPYQGISHPVFSYKYVYELVFNKGKLETSIEHSRAMLRIRKNIELGLRSLSKKQDLRCIRRFINSILIGDYKPFHSPNKKIKYINELKDYYQCHEK